MKQAISFLLLCLLCASAATAQGPTNTWMTYQGQLRLNGQPVNNVRCDVQFTLWDAPSGGNQVGPLLTRTVTVRNGLFSVGDLDYGASFDGAARWLQIAARCPSGTGAFVTLAPRALLTAVPYAHSLRPGAAVRGNVGVTFVGHNQATSGFGVGVRGRSDSPDGYGVHGWNTANDGRAIGVYGQSSSPQGRGVYGLAALASGVNTGVYGESPSPQGRGVLGIVGSPSGLTYAVVGIAYSPQGYGLWGSNNATSGDAFGVVGWTESPNGTGVIGVANATGGQNYGVRGVTRSPGGYAGYFEGRVHVIGALSATGPKSFRIPHPSLPGHELYHYAQESPRPENVYSGLAALDAQGQALVELPDYFPAVNAPPYRYTLTPIGAPMPNLHVSREVEGRTFAIAGGAPGGKVSWMLIAVRADLQDAPTVARAGEEVAPLSAPGLPVPPEVEP